MTMQEFVAVNRIRMTAEWIGRRPDGLMDDMPAGSNHYRCTLKRGTQRMTVYFSMGPAHSESPSVADVLECLASDATGADEDFESWCRDLGLDTDSRRAERIYKATVKATASLKRLLNGSFDALLYEVTR